MQPGDVNPGYSHRLGVSLGVIDTKNELCPARKEFGVLPTEAGIRDLSDCAARQIAQVNCVPAISIGLKRDRLTVGRPGRRTALIAWIIGCQGGVGLHGRACISAVRERVEENVVEFLVVFWARTS